MKKSLNKICILCEQEKPETEEFFNFRKDSGKYRNDCIICHNKHQVEYYNQNKEKITKYQKEYKEKCPWKIIWHNIHNRCVNPNHISYKYYGGKGIKNHLSLENIKFLWYRDKAYLMKQPSIDRKNSNQHYEFSNCRFIELKKNIIKSNKESNIKSVLQFDLNGVFIKEWKSATEASKKLKLFQGNISSCCLNKVNSCGGFIWKFKNIRAKYKTTKV